jgi:hypothetical protein
MRGTPLWTAFQGVGELVVVSEPRNVKVTGCSPEMGTVKVVM